MDLDILNTHVMKIIIACRKEDSIRAISKRINLSYGWTYKWSCKLAEIGVFKKKGKKLFLNEGNKLYRTALKFLREAFKDNVEFYYNILSYFGIKYCFTGIDAVYVWTDGGYNIIRYKDYYPIFIKIKRSEKEIFEFYLRKIRTSKKVFYKPIFLEDFQAVFHNDIPVDRLDDVINFMEKYKYNFEPALEMIQEEYKRDFGIKYKEVSQNV